MKQFLHTHWQVFSRTPFGCLLRLFVTRMFHGGGEPGAGELDLGIGVILIMLAMPGMLVSLLMLEKYASLIRFLRGNSIFDPYTATIPDEYFFLVLSLTVTGAVALWRWDALFLDRRDYAFGPLIYLEKIFQIPYSLRPMEETGFQQLMNKLTQTTEFTAETQNPTPPADRSGNRTMPEPPDAPTGIPAARPSSVEPGSPPIPSPLIEATVVMRPFLPNPKRLKLEECERRLMRQLYPLIPSPRAAKRTANIYRLLRCSIPQQELELFVKSDETGEYQAAQLLLAIQVGYPEQAEQIIQDLAEAAPLTQGKWWEFVGKQYKNRADFVESYQKTKGKAPEVRERADAETRRWRAFLIRLFSLKEIVATKQPCQDFIKWAPRVARFSFRSLRLI